jgi:hypothetical protein
MGGGGGIKKQEFRQGTNRIELCVCAVSNYDPNCQQPYEVARNLQGALKG